MNKFTVQSKKTFATQSGAKRACEKAGKEFISIAVMPSGRFAYVFPDQNAGKF